MTLADGGRRRAAARRRLTTSGIACTPTATGRVSVVAMQKLLTLALALFAVTTAAQTTRVGSETKRTIGTITNMESGDVACYLTMKDDGGNEFTELADYAICENASLIAKRVSLSWTIAAVMADECQGDPECSKTRKAAIVSAVKLAGPAKKRSAAPKVSQTSFCTPDETIVFSCPTGRKVVSVCASKSATASRGMLQYRFGKPGEPLELALPVNGAAPAKAATGESVAYAGGGATWLRFRSGVFGYVVYSGIGRWRAKGKTIAKEGVVVEKNGKAVATLPCTSSPVSILGPEWLEQTGIPTHGETFDLPD